MKKLISVLSICMTMTFVFMISASAACPTSTLLQQITGNKELSKYINCENGVCVIVKDNLNSNNISADSIKELLEKFGVKVEIGTQGGTSGGTGEEALPETDTENSTPQINASAFEKEVLDLVNAERAKKGLNALEWSNELATVARAHSKDMSERGFFSHTNPDGLSAFDRIKNAGIKYSYAAENIAAGQSTPQEVVTGWMNSAGHRANILNPNLKKLGVGLYKSTGGYKYYWTQNFIG